MREPAPTVRQLYGEMGQSVVDRLAEILCDHNPASSLSFFPEQRCFHISGFPDMYPSECLEIFSQVKSTSYDLKFQRKSAEGIIIFRLMDKNWGNLFQKSFGGTDRTSAAIRARIQLLAA